jgi:hypothetical protein
VCSWDIVILRKEANEKKEKALSGEQTKRQGQQGETEQKKNVVGVYRLKFL